MQASMLHIVIVLMQKESGLEVRNVLLLKGGDSEFFLGKAVSLSLATQ